MPTSDAEAEQNPLELSRRLVYFAAERTLTSWIRTALSLMALGFVVDRFGLIERMLPGASERSNVLSKLLSDWAGSTFIGVGALMALAAGVRHLRFELAYRRAGTTSVGRGALVGSVSAFVLALLGMMLIVLLMALLD